MTRRSLREGRFLATMGAFVSVGVLGCFPIVVRTQPSIRFSVVDHAGNPIEGATLHLVAYRTHHFSYGQIARRLTLQTRADGRASVSSRFECQLFIPAPDLGADSYDWAWCVDKPGFEPANHHSIREVGMPAHLNVVLRATNSGQQCPEWGDRVSPRP